jgi:hypothetical protein
VAVVKASPNPLALSLRLNEGSGRSEASTLRRKPFTSRMLVPIPDRKVRLGS